MVVYLHRDEEGYYWGMSESEYEQLLRTALSWRKRFLWQKSLLR